MEQGPKKWHDQACTELVEVSRDGKGMVQGVQG